MIVGGYNALAALPDGRFLWAYADWGDTAGPSDIRAAILEVAANNTVAAPTTTVLVGNTDPENFQSGIELVALDATHYAVFVEGGGRGLAGWVLTVSGSTITAGPRQNLVAFGTYYRFYQGELYQPFVAGLDATHCVVVGTDLGLPPEGATPTWSGDRRWRAAIITISGDTMTLGTWRTIGELPLTNTEEWSPGIVALTGNRFFVCGSVGGGYWDTPPYTGPTMRGMVITADVPGDTFTLGTPVTLLSTPYFAGYEFQMARSSDGARVVVVAEALKQDPVAGYEFDMFAFAVSISGTTVSVSTPTSVSSRQGGYYFAIHEVVAPRWWVAVGMAGDVEFPTSPKMWEVRAALLDVAEGVAVTRKRMIRAGDSDYFAMAPAGTGSAEMHDWGRVLAVAANWRPDPDQNNASVVEIRIPK